MTLGEFRQLTAGLGDSKAIVVAGRQFLVPMNRCQIVRVKTEVVNGLERVVRAESGTRLAVIVGWEVK